MLNIINGSLKYFVSILLALSINDTAFAESKAESKSESKAESKAESKTESQVEGKAESQLESKAESKTEGKVKIWEEEVTIPTYPLGEAEDDPMFYYGRTYQGAQGREYPYPFLDALIDKRVEDSKYNMVYLENEYIKVGVLPEIGGRVFSGMDKTNGYDFIYRQDVIKPQLIGMLGAWISGGIEFDMPHHHRARAYMPMNYIMKENEDGSKTIWMSELELRHRTKSLIGITVYPDRSVLEASIRLFNPSPFAHSFLCFANTAVHVNHDYQVIFPPGTAYATSHHKTEMIEWPVGNNRFNHVDYDNVDLSWWKNHPKSQSFFAWNYEDDFFGGYDHAKDAGTISISNHHISPGMKFFEWGPGPVEDPDTMDYREEVWNKILTDKAGPYLELMTGAFSDNQPDYSWRDPYETKKVNMYWYPVKETSGFEYANLDGAVNIVPVDNSDNAELRLITTSEYSNAALTVRQHGKKILEAQIDIDPAHPYLKTISLMNAREKLGNKSGNPDNHDDHVNTDGPDIYDNPEDDQSDYPDNTNNNNHDSPHALDDHDNQDNNEARDSPDVSFNKDQEKLTGISVTLTSDNGNEIMHYEVKKKKDRPAPDKVKSFESPGSIKSVEELYYTGLRLQQFHNGRIDPYLYYNEALKRDPGNYQVNTIIGIDYLKRGMFVEAEEKLRTAVSRIGSRYTSPRDGEALYYLGLALAFQDKIENTGEPFFKDLDDAYDAFYKASWDYAFKSPAYFQLAMLDCKRGDYATALKHINKCTVEQVDNPLVVNYKAYFLKSAILRKLNNHDVASTIAKDMLTVDPLNFQAMHELYLSFTALGEINQAEKIKSKMHEMMKANKTQNYLEMAIDYAHAGLYREAIEWLVGGMNEFSEVASYPLIHYYLGYLWEKEGNMEKAGQYYSSGHEKPIDYCFPFRIEMYDVLSKSLRYNEKDAKAYYYLGNLCRYHEQINKAIKNWEMAISMDKDNATAYRNLGLTHARFKKDLSKGMDYLENAVETEHDDPRIISELDELYEQAQVNHEKRLAFMESHKEALYAWSDDMGYYRMVDIYMITGNYDKALKLLNNNHFRRWEGGEGIHKQYVNALILRGRKKMEKNDMEAAIQDFKAALKYPANLDNGKLFTGGPEAMVYYHLGKAYEMLGDEERAEKQYQNAIESKHNERDYEVVYYKGQAYKELKRTEKANEIFNRLISRGENLLNEQDEVDMFAKFSFDNEGDSRSSSAHCLIGLGYLGKGKKQAGKQELKKAVELDINNLWAKIIFNEVK